MNRSNVSLKPKSAGFFDEDVLGKAEATAAAAVSDLLSGVPGPRGVVVTAPAGAGKSHLVSAAVGRARDAGLRVAVAAPTNEQAFGLVRTIARLHCAARPGESVTFVPAQDVSLPADVAGLSGVREQRSVAAANGEDVVVGTLSKFGDAFGRGSLAPFDALLVDESYQADSAKYFATAGLAPLHLLVGDGGQISPFATIRDPARWRGLPEDPLQTAVGVLRRNHPATPVHGLPISRRLDPRAVTLARAFYPSLPFDAAVRPGVRRLMLRDVRSVNRRVRAVDKALDLSASEGWAHVELPRAPVLQADPETAELIVSLVARLFARGPNCRCEKSPETRGLAPDQVAVGVSHNDQKDLLRSAFEAKGLGVVVETANKLQGLEFEVTVVWHPMAGLPEADEFHLDPGRLCVLLTRHRQACVVVGREGDAELLEGQLPPSTPAYLDWDPDPVLDGWEAHGSTYAGLEPFRIGV